MKSGSVTTGQQLNKRVSEQTPSEVRCSPQFNLPVSRSFLLPRTMQGSADDLDRRVRHTRVSIVEALVQLALERRYDQIKTSDLIAAAGVGRSTFYEHFRSKDEVLLAAMEPLLLPIANAAAGRGAKAHLRAMLDHVWYQRALGKLILDARVAVMLQRKLAAMIEARLENETGLVPPAMLAMSVAAESSQYAAYVDRRRRLLFLGRPGAPDDGIFSSAFTKGNELSSRGRCFPMSAMDRERTLETYRQEWVESRH